VLENIKIVPLAAESLGVRSMCTYVETPDIKILLDAGVSLCPNRFGLPPHPREFEAIGECRRKIAQAARKADLVTISHYHFDHHTPSFEDWLCNWTAGNTTAAQIYSGKTVLMKNTRETINYSQRHRGWMFEKTGGEYAAKLEYADGKSYIQGDTKITFSEPVPHGEENSMLGWVLMTTIECQNEKFMFAPDVQGPMSNRTLEMITKMNPALLMVGGPPSYLAKSSINETQVQAALKSIETLVEHVSHVIIEHHILRDENWQERLSSASSKARAVGHTLSTAAEYLGKENCLLEAARKKLFAEKPPSEDFKKWMRESEEARKRAKPPI